MAAPSLDRHGNTKPAHGKAVDLRRRLSALLPTLLALGVLALAAAAQIADPAPRAALRRAAFDAYEGWLAGPPDATSPLRLVDIDEESLTRLGQWPWPRTRIAEIVLRAREAGAAVVAFDVVFAEPDRTSPVRVAENWGDGAAALAPLLAGLPDHDAVLAAALREAGRIVVAFTASNAGGGLPGVKARFIEANGSARAVLPDFPGAITTLPLLENSAAGNGSISFKPDSDGVIRRVPLLFRIGDRLTPSLALETLRVALGTTNVVVEASEAEQAVTAIRIGAERIVTDAEGAVWPAARAALTRERTIPAWHLADRAVPLPSLDGAIVLVGSSAQLLQDLRFAADGLIPGVEMHARVIDQVLTETYRRRPSWAGTAELGFLLLFGGIVIALSGALGPVASAVVAAAAVATAVGGGVHLAASERLLLDPLFPSVTVIACFLVGSVARHARTQSERAFIRRAFSSYVSPNLVDHLLADPGALELGGQRRECSFVLTDLAGFTSLVEQSEATSVVRLLNEYLEGMLTIAFRHDGTVDRIVGDAVAVMFSAPVEQKDHAARAVACAIDMDRFARDFARAKQAEGLPLRGTRIGVHSGIVTVGNVGGRLLLDYRALGDPINTASRLETVNRRLGTTVCVSGATVALCPDFVGRPIGTLFLPGKSDAIDAYEPLTAERAASAEMQSYVEGWHRLKAGDREGARGAFAGLSPHDPLAALHLARIDAGESGVVLRFDSK